jgi:hypothetical protein
MPRTRPWSTSSLVAAVSGRMIAPASSACSASQRPSSASEATRLPWFFIVGGVGIRTARLLVRK